MAYLRNSPLNFNPMVKSTFVQPFVQQGTPLPPPPPSGDFLLMDGTDFLLMNGTNFKLMGN